MTEKQKGTSAGTGVESRFCIICSGEASNRIVKDENFATMLDFYWRGIGADVKPDMNKGFFLCLACYDAVLQFYQINDVLVCFEAKLKEAQMNILRKNIKGIVSWQEKGLKMLPFMPAIIQKWGTKLEPGVSGQNQHILQKFLLTHTKEDGNSK